jgi:hypothetical protein
MRTSLLALALLSGCVDKPFDLGGDLGLGFNVGPLSGGDRAALGACPAGETCSAATPMGVDFFGSELGDGRGGGAYGISPTAVGGRQVVTLMTTEAGGHVVALATPFIAAATPTAVVGLDPPTASHVTMRGLTAGAAQLRLLAPDQLLLDRKPIEVADIEAIDLVAATDTLPDHQPIAVRPDGAALTVALTGGGGRLVDTAMTLALPSGAGPLGWDSFAVGPRAVGTYAVTVTAGGQPPRTLAFDVRAPSEVDHLERQPHSSCFSAIASGHALVALEWTFTVDGQAATGYGNCVALDASADHAVVAHAAGRQLAITIPRP